MAAAYCSTFGGTGTLVGTGTNLTFKGIYESTFPAAEGVNFTQWMVANIPQMVINSFLTWLYLRIAFTGFLRPRSKDAQLATIGEEGEAITNRVMKSFTIYLCALVACIYSCTLSLFSYALQVIQARYKDLGGITFHETGVAILFGACILLWIFRKPGFIRGWSEAITDMLNTFLYHCYIIRQNVGPALTFSYFSYFSFCLYLGISTISFLLYLSYTLGLSNLQPKTVAHAAQRKISLHTLTLRLKDLLTHLRRITFHV